MAPHHFVGSPTPPSTPPRRSTRLVDVSTTILVPRTPEQTGYSPGRASPFSRSLRGGSVTDESDREGSSSGRARRTAGTLASSRFLHSENTLTSEHPEPVVKIEEEDFFLNIRGCRGPTAPRIIIPEGNEPPYEEETHPPPVVLRSSLSPVPQLRHTPVTDRRPNPERRDQSTPQSRREANASREVQAHRPNRTKARGLLKQVIPHLGALLLAIVLVVFGFNTQKSTLVLNHGLKEIRHNFNADMEHAVGVFKAVGTIKDSVPDEIIQAIDNGLPLFSFDMQYVADRYDLSTLVKEYERAYGHLFKAKAELEVEAWLGFRDHSEISQTVNRLLDRSMNLQQRGTRDRSNEKELARMYSRLLADSGQNIAKLGDLINSYQITLGSALTIADQVERLLAGSPDVAARLKLDFTQGAALSNGQARRVFRAKTLVGSLQLLRELNTTAMELKQKNRSYQLIIREASYGPSKEARETDLSLKDSVHGENMLINLLELVNRYNPNH